MSDGTTTKPIQVREGRWKTRGGDIRNVTPTPSHDSRAKRWPWRDAEYDQTWTPNGRCQFNYEESPSDLVEYLGPIEPDKTPSESEPTLPEAVITRLATAHSQLEEAADEISRLRGRLDNAERLLEQRPVQVDYRPRTYFIDIDGTLVQHAMKGQADNVTTSRLPGAKDFIDRLLAAGHRVILTTGRRKTLRLETEQQLSDAKIAYDELIMDLPPGIRIIVNDAKPDVPVTAYGITVPRNQGCLDIMRWEEHTLPGKAHAKVQGADAP